MAITSDSNEEFMLKVFKTDIKVYIRCRKSGSTLTVNRTPSNGAT